MIKGLPEIWVPVANCDGYYISNLGRVKSCKRKSDIYLKPLKTKFGYYRVCLHTNGVKKYTPIHRLVAEAFIPNPDNLPEVNHKDEVKSNNRVDNLEWCTPSYNNNYGTRNIRAGLSNRGKRNISIVQLSNGNLIRVWDSAKDAAQALNLDPSNITRCCRGGRKTTGGYEWRYAREEITR